MSLLLLFGGEGTPPEPNVATHSKTSISIAIRIGVLIMGVMLL